MSPYRARPEPVLARWLCRLGLHAWIRILGSGMHGYEERCARDGCAARRWVED